VSGDAWVGAPARICGDEVVAGSAVIRDIVCAHAPTPACGHGFKVVLSELCAGRVRLQARVLAPRRWGIAPMTKPFGILSGADRDHIDADIAVGQKFHHAHR